MISFEPTSVTLTPGRKTEIILRYSPPIEEITTISFTYQFGNKIYPEQTDEVVKPLANFTVFSQATETSFIIEGENVNSVIIGLYSNSSQFENLNETILRVSVVHSLPVVTLTSIIGWVYFIFWSVSFYPQIWVNFRRKSVVGLSFDFLALNLTGFVMYGIFNVCLFWIHDIQSDYLDRHPNGVIPVQTNDVFFAMHAVFITSVTIFQCCIYERGEQKVTKWAVALLIISWVTFIISLILSISHVLSWLNFAYNVSYVKLAITIVKYIPQAYMNYVRKSTDGWSIGNILCDFTGGFLSVIQMFILAYNNDDWSSIFGDPTKFGLGFFSVLFDVLFMVQHYCLYRISEEEILHIEPEEEPLIDA